MYAYISYINKWTFQRDFKNPYPVRKKLARFRANNSSNIGRLLLGCIWASAGEHSLQTAGNLLKLTCAGMQLFEQACVRVSVTYMYAKSKSIVSADADVAHYFQTKHPKLLDDQRVILVKNSLPKYKDVLQFVVSNLTNQLVSVISYLQADLISLTIYSYFKGKV